MIELEKVKAAAENPKAEWNGEFIAAVDPDTVLALIAVTRQAGFVTDWAEKISRLDIPVPLLAAIESLAEKLQPFSGGGR